MELTFGAWRIRSYQEQDVAAVVKYGNNYKIWINLTNIFPHPYTEADAQSWIQQVKSQEPECNFAIASAEELIGGIGFGIKGDIHCKSAMFGYWLGEPFWGKGIATQAVKTLVNYLFTHHDLLRVYAGVFAWNPASGRVLEKAGFTLEGRFRQHVFKDGKVTDLLTYGLLREEWQDSPLYH